MSILMGSQLSRNYWWSLLIRGIAAIIFGILALVWPGLTLYVLVTLFGAYALIDGIVAIYVALQERSSAANWWVLLIEGIAGVLFGIATFFWPAITALALLYLVAFWAIVTGVMEVWAAFALRRTLTHEWTLAVAGILSLLFGIVLLVAPGRGLLALLWLVGIYAIVFGVLFLVRAFQFRALAVR